MRTKYAIAPEFASLPSVTFPSSRLLLRGINLLMKLQRRGFTWSDEVRARTHSVHGGDGNEIPVFEVAPRDLSGSAPALVVYHGGGFFLSYASGHLTMAERYALAGRCRVFFPAYRLSIDHPFPAGFDDCYATLSWVHANAAELGVDPQRVALLGDSAGGALAAGVAQKALDRDENPVVAQILIYPVLDHESKTESVRRFTDTPLWRRGSNLNMWKVYLRGSPQAPAYAAPLHRESFAGLPPARIEVAEFDPLHDEGLLYAAALEAAGVPVEVREAKAAVHGYDLIENSPITRVLFEERIETLRRFLGTATVQER